MVTRTTLIAALLMTLSCTALILINLFHAHSQLDSLQALVEEHAHELQVIAKAHVGSLREKDSQWASLSTADQDHQDRFKLQDDRISRLATAQKESSDELTALQAEVADLKASIQSSKDDSDKAGSVDTEPKAASVETKQELSELKHMLQTLRQEVKKLAMQLDPEIIDEGAPVPDPPLSDELESDVDMDTQSFHPDDAKRLDSETMAVDHIENEGLDEKTDDLDALPPIPDDEGDISQVLWFRECGCTGIEVEAVTLLQGLVGRMHHSKVKTNRCEWPESCKWPAETMEVLRSIEVEESSLWSILESRSFSGRAVVVMHAAYLGVCGISGNLELVLQGQHGDEIRSRIFLISRSMIEVDKLDEQNSQLCNSHFDQVWVPSTSSYDAFLSGGVYKDNLKVLPEAIDTRLFNCSVAAIPKHPRHIFSVAKLDKFIGHTPKDSFTFLSNFKWEERKNWKGLLESFVAAFPKKYTSITYPDGQLRNVSVRLLIKTFVPDWSTDPDEDLPSLFSTLEGASSDDPSLQGRLLLLRESLETSQLPNMYGVADAFVLPTHGEGWGLPIMEAMACGLPTISTGWGGQTEFMNQDNSWLIGHTMVENNDGALWAEPDTSQLANAMKEVVAGGQAVRLRADTACKEVAERFAIPVVAEETFRLLESLAALDLGSGSLSSKVNVA